MLRDNDCKIIFTEVAIIALIFITVFGGINNNNNEIRLANAQQIGNESSTGSSSISN
jgi:hypothetical protein